MELDHEPIAGKGELFSIEKNRVEFKNTESIIVLPFDDLSLLGLVCFDAFITKIAKSFERHVEM